MKWVQFFILFSWTTQLIGNPYLEPYIGHDLDGKANNKIITGETYHWEFEGTHLGLKAGYSFWNALTFGLEYGISRFGFRGTSYEAAYTNERMHGSIWGLFALYRFPDWAKIWTSFLFYSQFKYDEGESDNDRLIGDGFTFGLGFTKIPHMDINLEYRAQTLAKYYNNDTGRKNPLNFPYHVNQFLLSLSFPIQF